jgi:hypothetical protein
VQNLLYGTNQVGTGLLDYLGATLETSSNVVEWHARPNPRPLISAGQEAELADDPQALAAIINPTYSSAKEIFFAGKSPSRAASTCLVTNVLWKSEFVSFETIAARDTVASVAQSYSHNWHAFVDGIETPVLRANYAFQALMVPAGTHRVELRYRDRAFQIGSVLSIVSLLGLAYFSRPHRVGNIL